MVPYQLLECFNITNYARSSDDCDHALTPLALSPSPPPPPHALSQST